MQSCGCVVVRYLLVHIVFWLHLYNQKNFGPELRKSRKQKVMMSEFASSSVFVFHNPILISIMLLYTNVLSFNRAQRVVLVFFVFFVTNFAFLDHIFFYQAYVDPLRRSNTCHGGADVLERPFLIFPYVFS